MATGVAVVGAHAWVVTVIIEYNAAAGHACKMRSPVLMGSSLNLKGVSTNRLGLLKPVGSHFGAPGDPIAYLEGVGSPGERERHRRTARIAPSCGVTQIAAAVTSGLCSHHSRSVRVGVRSSSKIKPPGRIIETVTSW